MRTNNGYAAMLNESGQGEFDKDVGIAATYFYLFSRSCGVRCWKTHLDDQVLSALQKCWTGKAGAKQKDWDQSWVVDSRLYIIFL